MMRLDAGVRAVAKKNLKMVFNFLRRRDWSDVEVYLDAFCVASSRRVHVMNVTFLSLKEDDETNMSGVFPLPVAASTLTPPSSKATSTSRWPSCARGEEKDKNKMEERVLNKTIE